jgi:hypothetical protein
MRPQKQHETVKSMGLALAQAGRGQRAVARRPDRPVFGVHVLLIMASGTARDSLAAALWNAGLLVTVFATAHDAEDALCSQPLDAVVVDAAQESAMPMRVAAWLRAVGKPEALVVALGAGHPPGDAIPNERGPALDVSREWAPVELAARLAHLLGAAPQPWR